MTATGASGLADQSFSTRLYRATQRHKHWFFIAPALLIVLTVVIYPIIFSTGVSFLSRHLRLAITAFRRTAEFRAHAQQR